jgi:hypothetical protein
MGAGTAADLRASRDNSRLHIACEDKVLVRFV